MNFAMSFKMFDKFIYGFRTEKQFEIFMKNIKNLKPLSKKTIQKILNLHKNNKFFSIRDFDIIIKSYLINFLF